jgi:hypothetical protein
MVSGEGALVVDFVGVHRVAQRSSLVLVLLVQVELPRGRFGGSEQEKKRRVTKTEAVPVAARSRFVAPLGGPAY